MYVGDFIFLFKHIMYYCCLTYILCTYESLFKCLNKQHKYIFVKKCSDTKADKFSLFIYLLLTSHVPKYIKLIKAYHPSNIVYIYPYLLDI